MTLIVNQPKPRTVGCVRCGRGQFDPAASPVAVPANQAERMRALTTLVKIKCPMQANHMDPGDPHAQKCSGTVWAHEKETVCDAVRAQALRT